MNVILVSYMDFTGPGVIHMYHFANGLVRKGHKVLFLVNGSRSSVKAMAEPPLFDSAEIRFRNMGLTPALISKIKRFRPHLIHLWTPRNVPARVGLELKNRFDIPLLVHYEDDEDILFEQADSGDYFRHLSFAIDTFLHPDKWVWVHPFTYQWINVYADRLTVISPAYGRALEAHWGRTASLLIPGVDLARFSPDVVRDGKLVHSLGLEGKKVLVYGGSIAKFYEFQILLEAFRQIAGKFPDLHIIQYGRNFMSKEVNAFLEQHDLSARVHLLGQVPHHEVERYLALGDILVQPGQNNQFNLHRLPSKIPEYMAMGRPVILFSCGIGEYFEHRRHAYKLENGTASELAQAITEIMSDEKLRLLLSRGSREKAVELFSWPKSVDNLVSIYQSTVVNQVCAKPTSPRIDRTGLPAAITRMITSDSTRTSEEIWQELAGLREFHRKVTDTALYKVYFYIKLYLNRFLGREQKP